MALATSQAAQINRALAPEGISVDLSDVRLPPLFRRKPHGISQEAACISQQAACIRRKPHDSCLSCIPLLLVLHPSSACHSERSEESPHLPLRLPPFLPVNSERSSESQSLPLLLPSPYRVTQDYLSRFSSQIRCQALKPSLQPTSPAIPTSYSVKIVGMIPPPKHVQLNKGRFSPKHDGRACHGNAESASRSAYLHIPLYNPFEWLYLAISPSNGYIYGARFL